MEKAVYIIKVSNTNPEKLKFVLFGGNEYKLKTNYGSEKGVDIGSVFKNVTYLQILNQSTCQPVKINRIKIFTKNSIQRKELLRVTRTKEKSSYSFPIFPLEYINYYDEMVGVMDIPIDIYLDGETDISSEIDSKTEAIFMFYGDVIDTRNFFQRLLSKLKTKIRFYKFKRKLKN